MTTATMPGETSDGGGEDINGGQGRHIESLSLIFAQRRCEFFLLARKVAAQGWCLGLAYGDDRSRGYRRHPRHPLVHLTEAFLPSLYAYVRIFMFLCVFVTNTELRSAAIESKPQAKDMVERCTAMPGENVSRKRAEIARV